LRVEPRAAGNDFAGIAEENGRHVAVNSSSGSHDAYPLPELFTAGEWKVLAAQVGLSSRQVQVARLICRGLQKEGIAKAIGVSEFTIRMHANALYKRLRVHDRVGVVVRLVLLDRTLGRRKGRVAGP